jgi:hypothetical protein
MNKIEPENLAVFVCPHIFDDSRPILYVCREDGDWQFLCGHDDHDSDGHVIGVGHLTQRDPTLNELAELKVDWEAEREHIGSKWILTQCK